MKKRTKIVLITVLTLGVIGGAMAYGTHKFRDPAVFAEHVVSHISDDLNLDSAQEQALTALKDEILACRTKVHGQVDNFSDEVIALISADSFDQGQALEIVSGKTAAMNESAPAVIAALGNFLDGLNHEQKAKVVEFVKHKTEHRRHHHRGYH